MVYGKWVSRVYGHKVYGEYFEADETDMIKLIERMVVGRRGLIVSKICFIIMVKAH